MAKITQTSITLELETLVCDDMGDGIVMLDITVEEATELMNLLKERFSKNTVEPVWVHHPNRDWTNISLYADKEEVNWELEYSNLYHKVNDLMYRHYRGTTDVAELVSEWDNLIRPHLLKPKL